MNSKDIYKAIEQYVKLKYSSLLFDFSLLDDNAINERYASVQENIQDDIYLPKILSEIESVMVDVDSIQRKKTILSLFQKSSPVVRQYEINPWSEINHIKLYIQENYPSLLITPNIDLNNHLTTIKKVAGDDPIIKPLLLQLDILERNQNGDSFTMFLYLFTM